jgi:type I restriction enzyme S subunit
MIPVYGGNGITGYHDENNVAANTLVIGRVGFYCGATHITKENAWVTDNALIASFPESEINIHWLRLLIDCAELRKSSSSTAQPLVSGKMIYPLFVSLPPLAEQRRIVARIEQLLPHIEEYDTAEQKLTALNAAFPDQLKKSILQAAVQGKLVPQNPDDEPASVLLERIKAEKEELIKKGKAKRDKKESVIFRRGNSYYELRHATEVCIDDELPFDVPETWAWSRLGNVTYNHGQTTPQDDFCYIDIGSIDNKKQRLNKEETIVSASKAPSRARKNIRFGDILYSTVRPYLHNMCIVDRDFSRTAIASTGFAVLACHQGLHIHYLFYFLLSPDFDKYANSNENSKGVAYPAINDARFSNALVPLPPLAEQQRIVTKCEELLLLVEGCYVLQVK